MTVAYHHASDDNLLAETLNMRAAVALCPDVCSNGTRPYVGKCGAVAKDAPGMWCAKQPGLDAPLCCAADGGECCELDAAIVSGVVVGAVVGVTFAMLACCWCGKCCCFSYRKPQGVPVTAILMPAQQMQMAPMGAAYGRPAPQEQADGYSQVRSTGD